MLDIPAQYGAAVFFIFVHGFVFPFRATINGISFEIKYEVHLTNSQKANRLTIILQLIAD